MAYSSTTDFLALLRLTSGGARLERMPGLDFVVAAMARAGMFQLSVGQSAPTANQSTTVWIKPSQPSWVAEGVVYLWNADVSQYETATLPLWGDMLTQNSGGATAVSGISAPGGRVSLQNGVAIPTADIVGATNVFYMPNVHNQIWLPDATGVFAPISFSQVSQATNDASKSPAAVVPNSVYFMLGWDDNGVFRATRSAPWASDTSVGAGPGTAEVDYSTALPTNKYAVTNGPAANRGVILCAIRSNSASGVTDAVSARWVSNAYNAVPRWMTVTDPVASWTYNTATSALYRQANNNPLNHLDFLQCFAGGMLSARANGVSSCTSAGPVAATGIGIDQVTVNDALSWCTSNNVVAANLSASSADYLGAPGAGRHFANWLEYSVAGAWTTTFYGSGVIPGVIQTGINGWINN